ncbi:MAG: hypothetical protein R3346_04610 [Candidatus Spechtbacterales bacterium]|nr:hypothetical protein [Candidatus Spechtbacterales bacterium]
MFKFEKAKNAEDKEKLDQEQIDSLILEAEELDPVQRKVFEGVAKKLNHFLVEKYGEFMPEHTRDEVLHKRLVFFTNEDNYENFNETWEPEEKIEEEPRTHGITFLNQKLATILLKTFKMEINREDDEDVKNKTMLTIMYNADTIIHELSHMHQDQDRKRNNFGLFFEAGARYYTMQYFEQVIGNLEIFELKNGEIFTEEARKYQKLLDVCGNDVHKMFFGQKLSKSKRGKILYNFYKQ